VPDSNQIIQFYGSLATKKWAKPSFREQWFNSTLAEFKQSLRIPEKWFPAVAVVPSECLCKTELDLGPPGMPTVYPPPIRLISVETTSASVLLRIDQVVASRRWGNGFMPALSSRTNSSASSYGVAALGRKQ
jgi:hypothetical protein